ncbi:hypothetical protein [Campylobacter sp. US33a]|uniref:Periplasmic protein n=1 Tax=Campylobacter sp. CCS1377 TaxID=3158229 RepID=A0AAU7E5V6_9BACT|nr:hypothetical protein [Campylobacter sp. US33a]MCW1360716.1 hypothetical protein [Campylobacter jejuni]TEY00517.1 hypothetical protein ELQ16_09215 [Campylobacter sp. US33a]
MQKILRIDLEKRKALQDLKNLVLLGFGSTMLLNLNKESFLSKTENLSEGNIYQKYFTMPLNAFYVPDNLLHLLEIPRQNNENFYINILINSDTKYQNPLMQYAIDRKKEENVVYSLENKKMINTTFDSLNALKNALAKEKIYFNFLDLNSKNSLLNFYQILLQDENLKWYFYLKDNKFYIDEKASSAFRMNGDYLSLELYLRLLNEFKSLNKFELINILESLSGHNLKSLYMPRENEQNYALSNVIMNLRVK